MKDRKPPPGPGKDPRETEKAARLGAALRANLARRKAQKRERETGSGEAAKDGEQA